jgi:hypothetical protein
VTMLAVPPSSLSRVLMWTDSRVRPACRCDVFRFARTERVACSPSWDWPWACLDRSTLRLSRSPSSTPTRPAVLNTSSDGRVGPLAGSIITVRHGDVVKQYVIPTDVPAGFPAGGTLLIATSDDLSTGEETPPMSIPPDYVMPVRFLPTDGGTIDLDGYDPWTFDSLPIEGSLALLRSGATTTSTTHSFAAGSHSIVFGAGYSGAFEYYNPDLGQYFYTASEPDIDAIESGRLPGWQSTGTGLAVLTGPYPECCGLYGKVPVSVCRYFIPPAGHFYSAFTNECDQVATQFPSLVLETRAAFYVVLPKDQESGDCPVPSRPVYRLWNRETNAHRFVDSLDRRLPLLAQGWIPEGYGPAGVAWCQ